ncbi:hypothetical protein HMPREF1579_01094 [Gardnerella vaginalis JCP8066]|nr:hypothetical protein HMPREF1579_01094 [Gardnerella vaginalis JCP8066]
MPFFPPCAQIIANFDLMIPIYKFIRLHDDLPYFRYNRTTVLCVCVVCLRSDLPLRLERSARTTGPAFPHFVPYLTQITYKTRKNLPHFVPKST